ncbi:Proton pump-interactor 1 [Bienertia sinuspersici]
MGVEVAGSDLPKVNGDAKDNGKIDLSVVITFGSHGDDEVQSKAEAKDVSNAEFQKEAVDDWPEAAQTHYFWFVKYRPYDDPVLKAKLEQTEKDIQKKKQQIDEIYDDLNAKKSEKYELINELKAFNEESSQYWAFINEKREAMRPLQSALGSLRGGGGGEKGVGICSSEEELNHLIRSLEYRMQHESMSLKEEKQLLREIKELEGTRPKVIANGAMRAKIQESMGQKEAIQDQVKLLGTDLDGVRKQQAAIKAKKDRLTPQLDALKGQIEALQKELTNLKEKKNALLDTKQELRKKRDEGNANFYESRSILNNAKELALKKDVKALEEFNNAEAEKFMSQWNSSKAFRDDYEKRLLQSLDYRQLSRDGRIRNFDEKPLLKAESPSETEVAPKVTSKQPKEVAKVTPKAETLPAEKPQKESKKGSKESKIASEPALEEEEVFMVEKPKKDVSKENVDVAKLKEKKREEEMEKQRLALERKKKQQEKNAAKAALRAQKEAEKKQKEREKKMRKKGGSVVSNEEEPTEKSDADEPEKSDEVEEVVVTPIPSKAKVENAIRHRKTVKSRGTLPKAILKKKKSEKYWLWGYAAAATIGVLLLLVLGYKYLL